MLSFRNALRFCCAFALVFCPLLVHADTLNLVSTTGGSVNGEDIYPYNFSINGSSSLTSLVCLDYNRQVSIGEQWQVSVQSLDLGSSQTAIDYRTDAILYYVFGQYGLSNSDVQYAIWSIFDPDITSNTGFTSTSQTLVDYASYYAADPDVINSGFFSNFVLYTPTADQTGWTNGTPQEFIGAASAAPTPEPSSLALLGTGLISTALSFRKRFAARAEEVA
ncbi:PEP-CTERM sorting domain-containing protein [Terriglobus aquaticus]|uniref:PEP-CTERM sorting domain-containing protein n=1 Tax=Terriglobus aquaticus TaxID=940139 RepID=A0ABW9KQ23_9BACT|nr:PEP-CTERM sorting domain-containing protein [Terriglobus aquaticus]